MFPLFFLLAFVGGLSQLKNVPGFDFPTGYTSFQFVFVLLQSAAFGGVFTGFGIARDFEYGFTKRLLLAAPHRSAIIVGYAIAAFARWVVTASFLTVVAFLVGMHVAGNGVDIFGLYLLAAIVNCSAVLWAAGVAARLRTIQAGPADADARLPRPLPRAGLRAADAALRLDPLRRSASTRSRTSSRPGADSSPAPRLCGGRVRRRARLAFLFAVWAVGGLRRAEAAGGA